MCSTNYKLKANPRLANQFINSLIKANKSQKTIEKYSDDINKLFEYLIQLKNWNCNITDITDDMITSITVQDIESYDDYIRNKRKLNGDLPSVNTIITKIEILRSFFRYLTDVCDIFQKSPCRTLIIPQQIKNKQPIHLKIEEAETLIEAIDYTRGNERNKALITLFLYTGMRVSEIMNITATEYKSMKNNEIKVIGKGNKERMIPFTNNLKKVIDDYLLVRKNPIDNSDALFVSELGTKLGYQAINKVVKKYTQLAGIDKNITCHKLRHSFASMMFKNGSDLAEIQEIMGHENIATTKIYTHIDGEQRKRVMDNHPLNK